jgi:hypothetical protein
MPKKPKSPGSGVARPSIPWRIRVREDEGFRLLTVSVEGEFLGVVSIDDVVEGEAEQWEPEPVWKVHYQVTLECGRQDGELVR